MSQSLDTSPLGTAVRIIVIDWGAMTDAEGRRLRELGMLEGIEVTPLYRGTLFSRDPLALAVGRMQVVIRAAQAAAVRVEPVTA